VLTLAGKPRDNKELSTFSITSLQIDNTLSIISNTFLEREKTKLKKAKLCAKDKTVLVNNKLIKFNRGKISLAKSDIVLT
jgi:hypothetical protein